MSSRVEWLVGAATAIALVTGISASTRRATATPREQVLAVCADPNNLPFSNDKLEGFENKARGARRSRSRHAGALYLDAAAPWLCSEHVTRASL